MGAPSPTTDDSGVVAIGTVLDGRYRIDAVLGKGGMGRVYRGEHTGIGRAVAIKILHSALGRSKEATARFQREALASGRLDHANIVGVSDFGVLADGSLYLVMEALEGESLGTRLEREKRLPWQEAVLITRGLLAGLRHAHDRGVVHRDIKPDNIYLAKKDGEIVVKILDFGIAKLYAGNADDPATTRAGLTVGTPAYLSPEQAVGGAITPASDLYSTSVVLYEMLAGRVPFEDQDPLAMLTAHVSKDAPTFAEIAPDVTMPPGLEDIVRRGLAKVSAERIATANEYLQALDYAVGGGGATPIPRSSQSLSIPAGPHSLSPSPGFMATPMPFTAELGSSPSAAIPRAARPSLETGPAPQARAPSVHSGAHTGAPIPRKWLKVAVVVVAIAIVAAIGLVIFGGKKQDAPTTDNAQPSQPSVVQMPVPTMDKEVMLKAALHDLESGASCAERKTAIPKIVEIGDPSAIPALKKARYRMYGGVLGIGESNANSCLKADAEAAIKALGGK